MDYEGLSEDRKDGADGTSRSPGYFCPCGDFQPAAARKRLLAPFSFSSMAEIAVAILCTMEKIRTVAAEIKESNKQALRLVRRLNLLKGHLVEAKNGHRLAPATSLNQLKVTVAKIHTFLSGYALAGNINRALRCEANAHQFTRLGAMLKENMRALQLEFHGTIWAEEDERDCSADLEELVGVLEEMERKRHGGREKVARALEKLRRTEKSGLQDWIELDFAKDLDFARSVELGSGSFGTVRTAQWKGADVAVKKLVATGVQRDAIRALRKDLKLHCSLVHKFLVRLYAASTVKPELCLVMELVRGGSLSTYLRASDKPLEDALQVSFLYDIARGMQFLHSNGILHGDLRSTNVLLSSNDHLKLTDFGLLSTKKEISNLLDHGFGGRARWMSPEEIDGNPPSELTDVYSFGVVCFEVATRAKPFPGMGPLQVRRAVAVERKRPQIPNVSSPPANVVRLMKSCWQQKPSQRPEGFTPVVWTLSKVASRVGDPRKPRAFETQDESSSEAEYARDRSLARETNKRATFLFQQGEFDEAEPCFRKVLAIDKRLHGPDHPYVATDLNNLASLLRAQGRYEDADDLFQQAIEIGEETLGPDHPDVATRLNNRAGLLVAQDKYGEALPLLERALTIYYKKLGRSHDYTASTMEGLQQARQKQEEAELWAEENDPSDDPMDLPIFSDVGSDLYSIAETSYEDELAGDANEAHERWEEILAKAQWYARPLKGTDPSPEPKGLEKAIGVLDRAKMLQVEGKLEEAAYLFEKSQALFEAELGPMSPRVASVLNRRATALMEQGRYRDADAIYARAAEIIGEKSIKYPTILNKRAVSLHEQGKYSEAQELLEESREILERKLGLEHPKVARTLKNLADVFEAQGKYLDAELMHGKCVSIWERTLGHGHPRMGDALVSRANLLQQQGRHGEADPLLVQALAIREKEVGCDHPDYAKTLNSRAELLRATGSYRKADTLYLQAIDVGERKLGADHPSLAMWLNNRAELLKQQGRLSEADPLYLRAVEIGERSLGDNHPHLALWIHNRAGLLEQEGNLEEAEELYERAQSMRERLLGPDHPFVAESLNNRAILRIEQGRMEEADSLLKRALVICRKTWGPHHPRMATFLNNRASLLTLQDNPKEADALFNRAMDVLRLTVGDEHPHFATTLENRAYVLMKRGRGGEALPLFETVLVNRRKTLGEDHRDTIKVQRTLENEQAKGGLLWATTV